MSLRRHDARLIRNLTTASFDASTLLDDDARRNEARTAADGQTLILSDGKVGSNRLGGRLAALRALAAGVAGQVVAAGRAMAGKDAAAVQIEQERGRCCAHQERNPEWNDNEIILEYIKTAPSAG